jgi:hypothetical protein
VTARPPRIEVVTVQLGDDRYEQVLGQIRADRQLLDEVWSDSETRLVEQPGKMWVVVLASGVPAAWAAAYVEEHIGPAGAEIVLRCTDSYERRGPGRDLGLYLLAYRRRHEVLVAPSRLPGLTFLYRQPMALHEADGWYRTGVHDVSREPGLDEHPWWQLRRDRSGD